MNKILITGAAGFIGSHVSEKLLKEGRQVIGIDSLNDYYSPILKELNLSLLKKYENFMFVKMDILNSSEVFDLFKDKDISFVVHCAARAGVRASVADPFLYTQTNILGTQIILEAIRCASLETKTILFSSSSVYGVQDKTPFSETMVPNPKSPYGASKYAMELVAKQYNEFYALPIVIVRPFSIYGPRSRVDMAPFLIIDAAENGRTFVKYGANEDNKRDWTYIDDFVDGICKIINNYGFSSFEIINLGNSNPIGIDDFVNLSVRMVKELLKKEVKIVGKQRSKEELPITFADINKAKNIFGYNPKTKYEDGYEMLLRYYFDNREIYAGIIKEKNNV